MKTSLQPVCIVLLALAALGIFSGCATAGGYRLKQTRMDVDFGLTRYQNQVAF